MSSITARLAETGHITPPKFLPGSVSYEALTGSVAYGVSGDASDMDIVGFCIPPKAVVFPHLAGEIQGFGRHKKRFEQFQKHHIDKDGKQIDLTIYNIVKFFTLCMECNPNMIDSLFVPANCVMYSDKVGQLVREHRHVFLHKGAWHRYKGYAYSQMRKMSGKSPEAGTHRAELIEEFGYDTKFAYHLVRLIGEVEQILATGTMDLQKDKDRLKAIRAGEWTERRVIDFFTAKEKDLEALYNSSNKVPYSPDEPAIKKLLVRCLEMYYGDLSECVVTEDKSAVALRQIRDIADSCL